MCVTEHLDAVKVNCNNKILQKSGQIASAVRMHLNEESFLGYYSQMST